MIVRLLMMGTLMPILSARPNPQISTRARRSISSSTSTAWSSPSSAPARSPRSPATPKQGDSLTWLEWAAITDAEELEQRAIDAGEDPENAPTALELAMTREFATDPANWARANPALGIRITHDYVRASSARSDDPRAFASSASGSVTGQRSTWTATAGGRRSPARTGRRARTSSPKPPARWRLPSA
jgi:hypothetical protein